jgi:hypothetical protein
VTLENQDPRPSGRVRAPLPRALTAAFVNQALKASEGVAGLSAAMRGLIAHTAVMTAIAAVDADIRRMTRASPISGRVLQVIRESETPIVCGEPSLEIGDPADLEIGGRHADDGCRGIVSRRSGRRVSAERLTDGATG